MGNKHSNYSILDLKPATYFQLEDPILNLEKYVASGYTPEMALEKLREMCIKYGIPEPEKYEDIYFCGTITVINSIKIEKRLNPVFFKERRGKYFAIVFYPKL